MYLPFSLKDKLLIFTGKFFFKLPTFKEKSLPKSTIFISSMICLIMYLYQVPIKDLEACAIMVKSSDSAECTAWNPVRQLFTVWSWWGYFGPLIPSLLICKVATIVMTPQRVGVRSMLDYMVKHSVKVCSYRCYHLDLMGLKLLLLGFHHC